MSLLDKIKGILFDEEIEEIPDIKSEIKKEETQKFFVEEEKNPIKEIKIPKDDFVIEKDIAKSEPVFNFPIDFDDEEVEQIPKIKKEEVVVKKEIKHNTSKPRDFSSFLNQKDDKKQFKPTPIISPVYGILDQNYKKEDVIVKKDILRKPAELTLDEVRKRAFGSLEDDIEQNLTCEILKDDPLDDLDLPIKETVLVEDPVDVNKTIGELIEEDSMTIDIPKIESINDESDEYNNSDVLIDEIEKPKKSISDLLNKSEGDEEKNKQFEQPEIKQEDIEEVKEIDDEEADLFSLIDSMYEEKGE